MNERELIDEAIRAGKVRVIPAGVGGTVEWKTNRQNLEMKRRKEERMAILPTVAAGRTVEQLARKFGVSESTIKRDLRSLGIAEPVQVSPD